MTAAICKYDQTSGVQPRYLASPPTSNRLKNQPGEAKRREDPSCVRLLFIIPSRKSLLFPNCRTNKDVENAFVAKYEITLDECLAWTKAKSRPLCCALKLVFLWKRNTSAPPPPPEFPLCSLWCFAVQSTLRNPQRKPKASCSAPLVLLFVLPELAFNHLTSVGLYC